MIHRRLLRFKEKINYIFREINGAKIIILGEQIQVQKQIPCAISEMEISTIKLLCCVINLDHKWKSEKWKTQHFRWLF